MKFNSFNILFFSILYLSIIQFYGNGPSFGLAILAPTDLKVAFQNNRKKRENEEREHIEPLILRKKRGFNDFMKIRKKRLITE
ncbi:hypothetical protein ACQ4LE_005836 [Meloidogyne hapla]